MVGHIAEIAYLESVARRSYDSLHIEVAVALRHDEEHEAAAGQVGVLPFAHEQVVARLQGRLHGAGGDVGRYKRYGEPEINEAAAHSRHCDPIGYVESLFPAG